MSGKEDRSNDEELPTVLLIDDTLAEYYVKVVDTDDDCGEHDEYLLVRSSPQLQAAFASNWQACLDSAKGDLTWDVQEVVELMASREYGITIIKPAAVVVY